MRFLAFLLAIAAPFQAHALSCLPASVPATYERAQSAAETYVVVHGRLTVENQKKTQKNLPTGAEPKSSRVRGKIIGRSLSKVGFQAPFERDIKVDLICLGPWCGSVASGSDVLVFLKREGGSYILNVGPCGGDVFVNPQPKMLKQAARCFKNGQC
jgi:hypothetical protein